MKILSYVLFATMLGACNLKDVTDEEDRFKNRSGETTGARRAATKPPKLSGVTRMYEACMS